MKRHISFQHIEGLASRQAHAKLPEGTYEREMGKEGFFGPAAHIYHKNPPTGWIDWEGPLRPRALDLNRLIDQTQASAPGTPSDDPAATPPVQAALSGAPPEAMDQPGAQRRWRRPAVPAPGQAVDFFCDYGHLEVRSRRLSSWSRAARIWRLESAEAMHRNPDDRGHRRQLPCCPTSGLVGAHAVFDPAILDLPAHRTRPSRTRRPMRPVPARPLAASAIKRGGNEVSHRDLSPSTRWTPSAGKAIWRRSRHQRRATSGRC